MASNPHRWRILAVVATAFFMTILDVSIVNVALPSIGEDLEFAPGNLQWVITAYAIVFGGFLLLGGRAADCSGVGSCSWSASPSSRSRPSSVGLPNRRGR